MTSELQNADMLPANFQLGPHHVVVGSRNHIYTHYPGNVRFQNVVNSHLHRYQMSKTKQEKSEVISEVITRFLQEGASKTGGFVRYDRRSGRWCKVGYFLARQRTSQAFRDALHETYKSSKVNKRKTKNLGRLNSRVNLIESIELAHSALLSDEGDDVSCAAESPPSALVEETNTGTDDAKLYDLLETAMSASVNYDDINPLEPSPIKAPESIGSKVSFSKGDLWRSMGATAKPLAVRNYIQKISLQSLAGLSKTKNDPLSFPEFKYTF